MMDADQQERLVRRLVQMLLRPGAHLEAAGEDYAVRADADRRRRPIIRIDEAVFRALVQWPGLKPREEGGWRLIAPRPAAKAPAPGRPGLIEGERMVAEADGRLTPRRANLGESPIAWLARRRDPQGRPWLTPKEAMAGERLREDFHRSGTVGRLTMDWSGALKTSGSRAPGLDPAERGVAAKQRVLAALEAAGPEFAPMLQRVCLTGSALEAAERDLGLPRRSGKTVLKMALGRLARHYGLG